MEDTFIKYDLYVYSSDETIADFGYRYDLLNQAREALADLRYRGENGYIKVVEIRQTEETIGTFTS